MKVEEVNKYRDPDNVNEILEKIKLCSSLKDIEILLKEVYPDWIIEFLQKYSYDYPHLQMNWENMTKNFNIKHAQIMIVDEVIKENKENYSLLIIFSEIFTRSGFIVRGKDELFPCRICGSAIPNEEIYNKIKESKIEFIPSKWQKNCVNCV